MPDENNQKSKSNKANKILPRCPKINLLQGNGNVGGASCTKFYILSNKAPLFLALPSGMPSPDDGEWAYADNIFRLKGYEYVWVEKNYFTNSRTETPTARFDVISWELVTPYKKQVTINKEGGATEFEESNEPVVYDVKNNDHNPSNFKFRSYMDCLNQYLQENRVVSE